MKQTKIDLGDLGDRELKVLAITEQLADATERLIKLGGQGEKALAVLIQTGLVMMADEKTRRDLKLIPEAVLKNSFSDSQKVIFADMLKKMEQFKSGEIKSLKIIDNAESISHKFEIEQDPDATKKEKEVSSFITEKMNEMLLDKTLSPEEIAIRTEILAKDVEEKFEIKVELHKLGLGSGQQGDSDITEKIAKLCEECRMLSNEDRSVEMDSAAILSTLMLCRTLGATRIMIDDIGKSMKIYQWLYKVAKGLGDDNQRKKMEKEITEDPDIDQALKDELKNILNNKPNKN